MDSPLCPFVLSYEELGALSQDAPGFLVQDYIEEASVNLMVGDSGLGKTALCVQLGMCVASGLPFFGKPTRQGRVLYVDCENGHKGFFGIMTNMKAHLGLPRPEMRIWSPRWDSRENMPADLLTSITEVIAVEHCDLVIIDPLRLVFPTAEGKSEDAVRMYNSLSQLSRSYGTSWLIVHHRRKVNADATKRTKATLEDDPQGLLQETNGSLAVVTHMGTRFLVERVGTDAIKLGGYQRITGNLEVLTLKRVRNADGDPLGYETPGTLEALSEAERDFYHRLPQQFTWNEGQVAAGCGNTKYDRHMKLFRRIGALLALGGKKGYVKAIKPLDTAT